MKEKNKIIVGIVIGIGILFLSINITAAPEIDIYKNFESHTWDCLDIGIIIFEEAKQEGRNVTYEYGTKNNSAPHLWIEEKIEGERTIIAGGPKEWVDTFNNCRLTWNTTNALQKDTSWKKIHDKRLEKWLNHEYPEEKRGDK